MEDKKLNLIQFNQEHQQGEKLVAVSSQPVAPEQEDKDELQEGEIQQDGAEQQQQQQDDVAAAASKSKKRTCPHCVKEFSNGKALRGHLRVHAKKNKSKPVKKPVGSSSSPEQQAPDFPCPNCRMTFKSRPSLYGHQRAHPERGWRGMQPPSRSHNSNTLNEPGPVEPEPETKLEQSSSAVEELRLVKGWKATKKRSWNVDYSLASTSTSSSFRHRAEAVLMADAAKSLYFLKHELGLPIPSTDDDHHPNIKSLSPKLKVIQTRIRTDSGPGLTHVRNESENGVSGRGSTSGSVEDVVNVCEGHQTDQRFHCIQSGQSSSQAGRTRTILGFDLNVPAMQDEDIDGVFFS